jgi:hypothetical protein
MTKSDMPGIPISEREFDLYALSLQRGPNFEPFVLYSAWKSPRGENVGAVLVHLEQGGFRTFVLRRQVDHRFAVTHEASGFGYETDALSDLASALRSGESAESLRPGEKRRPNLLAVGNRGTGNNFKLLTDTVTHFPSLMAIGEVYLAMPNPDDNFVPDFQTDNFDSRLWELYLLAAMREQGIKVTQPFPSPDFFLERARHECWVEAVTANPNGVRVQGLTVPTFAPENRMERVLGAPAVRFAKTLRSKLQREYEKAPHVQGKPFAIAIADFHAPGSMTWSREALPTYLYGVHVKIVSGPDGSQAVGESIDCLRGAGQIPAGLFREPSMSHLSAVIFSNAATLSKFNRMGFLAGFRPPGLTMTREGIIFDRTPGALEAKSFKFDVLSKEYAEMWPSGETWCQELEVFHNPMATYPINFDLLPGATHWFEHAGEIICSSFFECIVLSSVTHLRIDK